MWYRNRKSSACELQYTDLFIEWLNANNAVTHKCRSHSWAALPKSSFVLEQRHTEIAKHKSLWLWLWLPHCQVFSCVSLHERCSTCLGFQKWKEHFLPWTVLCKMVKIHCVSAVSALSRKHRAGSQWERVLGYSYTYKRLIWSTLIVCIKDELSQSHYCMSFNCVWCLGKKAFAKAKNVDLPVANVGPKSETLDFT